MTSVDIRSEPAVRLLAEFLDIGRENERKNAEQFVHGTSSDMYDTRRNEHAHSPSALLQSCTRSSGRRSEILPCTTPLLRYVVPPCCFSTSVDQSDTDRSNSTILSLKRPPSAAKKRNGTFLPASATPTFINPTHRRATQSLDAEHHLRRCPDRGTLIDETGRRRQSVLDETWTSTTRTDGGTPRGRTGDDSTATELAGQPIRLCRPLLLRWPLTTRPAWARPSDGVRLVH